MFKLQLLWVLFAAVLSIASTVQAQPVGQYFRPPDGQTSGVPGSRATYLRSPCPALNSLANHGFIPRNGRGLNPLMLFRAIQERYNVDFFTAQLQTSVLPMFLTLADLGKHNFIEHDMSLVHADSASRQDPSQIDSTLANDLMARANNGRLGVQEVGQAIRARLGWCQQKFGGCDFKSGQASIAFREAATLLQVFGGKNGATISVQHAYSFLVLEKFPDDWVRPPSSVTLLELQMLSARIRSAAGV